MGTNDNVARIAARNKARAEIEQLVGDFSAALIAKAMEAHDRGRSGWQDPAWAPEIRHDLLEHVDKGDPRDVALYAAFAWWHKQSLSDGGWRAWDGSGKRGPFPDDPKKRVDVRLRGGRRIWGAEAENIYWLHIGLSSTDVVAYRTKQPCPE